MKCGVQLLALVVELGTGYQREDAPFAPNGGASWKAADIDGFTNSAKKDVALLGRRRRGKAEDTLCEDGLFAQNIGELVRLSVLICGISFIILLLTRCLAIWLRARVLAFITLDAIVGRVADAVNVMKSCAGAIAVF